MRMINYLRSGLIAAAVFCAPQASFAQQVSDDAKPNEGKWYFTGDIREPGDLSIAAVPNAPNFAYEPFSGPTHIEMGLTFSNSSDVDRVGFANGQSIDLETDEDSYTFLVSGAYDVDTGTSITPHFMAGLGLSYSDVEGSGADLGLLPSELAGLKPAMQMGMGATYSVNEAFAFSASYRAFFLGDQLFDSNAVDNERSLTHNFMLGAKIKF